MHSEDTDVAINSRRASSPPPPTQAPPEVVEDIVPLPFRQALPALTGCALNTMLALIRGRLRQPPGEIGRFISFADGSGARVYRETVIERPEASAPAVLIVGFRLRHVRSQWAHAAFRLESVLNTILFAGFAGFGSKLWLRHDQRGLYRGIYQWDGAELAVAYVRALWWVLALVSEKDSIRYAVLPGRHREDALGAQVGPGDGHEQGGWWRVSPDPAGPRCSPAVSAIHPEG